MQKSSLIFKKLLAKRARCSVEREVAPAAEQIETSRRCAVEWSTEQAVRRKKRVAQEQRDHQLKQLEIERREAERVVVVRVAAAAALCECETPPTAAAPLARPSVARRHDEAPALWSTEGEERRQLRMVRVAREKCAALFGNAIWGKRVASAYEGVLSALPMEQEATAFEQLKPTLWSAAASHYQMGAVGGFKQLVRPNQFAFQEGRVPRAMVDAREAYGQLVVLTTRHKRNGHLAAFVDAAQELKLALQMAFLGIGPPVVAAALWRLTSCELAALYRSHGDEVPAALAVSSPSSDGCGSSSSTVSSFDERTAAQAGFITLVLPLCYSLHALLRNDDSDAAALFAAYEAVVVKLSCARVFLADAKPANFLCRIDAGAPPKVFASDFDPQHVRLGCSLAAPALMLAHHLMVFLHVSAEDATGLATGQRCPQRARFKELLAARIGQLWLRCQRGSESDPTIQRLLSCRFKGAAPAHGELPQKGDAELVALQIEHMLFGYFHQFERYARTTLGAHIERAIEARDPVVASLVAISVPELSVSWEESRAKSDLVHARAW